MGRACELAVYLRLFCKRFGAWESELNSAIKSGDSRVKIRALTLLSQQGPKPSTSVLIAATTDTDSTVRQFATWLLGDHPSPQTSETLVRLLDDPDAIVRRRACEAFVRSGMEAPADKLLALLGSSDRWLRFAARVALERVPASKWKTPPAGAEARLTWLLARQRAVPQEFSLQLALPIVTEILTTQNQPSRESLDAVRLAQLALLAVKPTSTDAAVLQSLGAILKQRFDGLRNQMGDAGEFSLPLRQETSKLMTHLQVPGAVNSLIPALETAVTPAEQAHYALCLSQVKTGWSADARSKLVRWYEKTGGWEGGNSLQGYLRNIMTGVSYDSHGGKSKLEVKGCLTYFDPTERKKYLLSWKQTPLTARAIISSSAPDQIADYVDVTNKLIGEVEATSNETTNRAHDYT